MKSLHIRMKLLTPLLLLLCCCTPSITWDDSNHRKSSIARDSLVSWDLSPSSDLSISRDAAIDSVLSGLVEEPKSGARYFRSGVAWFFPRPIPNTITSGSYDGGFVDL